MKIFCFKIPRNNNITVIDDSRLYMYITTIQINFTMSISDPFEDVILILQND